MELKKILDLFPYTKDMSVDLCRLNGIFFTEQAIKFKRAIEKGGCFSVNEELSRTDVKKLIFLLKHNIVNKDLVNNNPSFSFKYLGFQEHALTFDGRVFVVYGDGCEYEFGMSYAYVERENNE